MIDIFKYAEEFNEDYYDPEEYKLYKVKDYNKSLEDPNADHRIEVVDIEGNHIEYVTR